MRYVTKCLFVSAISTPKAHFEESKYKKPVWLDTKRNFLEKVAFWICIENANSQNGALRCILEKLLCVDESIRWVIGSVTKLPSLLLKTLTWPFSLLSYILSPLLQTNTGQEVLTKYKHSTTQLSPVYHHNPFQHLIIQTQNQQNQTKNNLKSTQTPLKNLKQNQLKIKPKIHRKSTQN